MVDGARLPFLSEAWALAPGNPIVGYEYAAELGKTDLADAKTIARAAFANSSGPLRESLANLLRRRGNR